MSFSLLYTQHTIYLSEIYLNGCTENVLLSIPTFGTSTDKNIAHHGRIFIENNTIMAYYHHFILQL